MFDAKPKKGVGHFSDLFFSMPMEGLDICLITIYYYYLSPLHPFQTPSYLALIMTSLPIITLILPRY